jgi:Dna[CI] antecedent, DciA
MRRLGDLLPEAASALGLDKELTLARAMTSWHRLVAELVPAAAGSTELLELRPEALLVSATEPIVAQELRLRESELLEAFGNAPGGARLPRLRVIVRPSGSPGRPGRLGGPWR